MVEVLPRFEPLSVMVKACPFTGGLGFVLMLLIDGAVAPADTVSDTPEEVSPVALFFTVTVNVPAARIAWPETCVLLPLALIEQGEPHPGPLK